MRLSTICINSAASSTPKPTPTRHLTTPSPNLPHLLTILLENLHCHRLPRFLTTPRWCHHTSSPSSNATIYTVTVSHSLPHYAPLMRNTSMSKTSVALGGIPQAGKPPSPYPMSGAKEKREPSPFVIVKTPKSQPRITDPVAALKLNGCWPGSLVLQNLAPPWRYPVHSTVTVSPWRTGMPIPGRNISFTNPLAIIWAILKDGAW